MTGTSPFRDPVVLGKVSRILRRRYERHLAQEAVRDATAGTDPQAEAS